MEDETIRTLFDASGAYMGPPKKLTLRFLCFAQGVHTSPDQAAIHTIVARFLRSGLGYYVPKRAPSTTDLFVVHTAQSDGKGDPLRFCLTRPCTSDDVIAADEAERRGGLAGLAELARRCGTIFEVEARTERDPHAMTMAFGLATHYAGPVIPPAGECIIGVRTLREWLTS